MPFTTPTLVKKHLLTATFPELIIRAHPVTFDGTTPIELPHHNLEQDSEAVKWDATTAPLLDNSVTLGGEDFSNMQHVQIVPGTILVTLSEALTTVYAEAADYQVDYAAGRIRRLESGAIPDSQAVLIYYSFYTVFTRDDDYTIDYAAGIVTRVESGIIPDGTAALVDYTVIAGTVEDDLIAQAITEAEDIIVRSLSPDYNASSTNQGLKTGATELTLSIICRAETIEALSRRATSDIPGRAKEWQQLSRFYEQQAYQTLAPFLLPMSLRSTYRQPREV